MMGHISCFRVPAAARRHLSGDLRSTSTARSAAPFARQWRLSVAARTSVLAAADDAGQRHAGGEPRRVRGTRGSGRGLQAGVVLSPVSHSAAATRRSPPCCPAVCLLFFMYNRSAEGGDTYAGAAGPAQLRQVCVLPRCSRAELPRVAPLHTASQPMQAVGPLLAFSSSAHEAAFQREFISRRVHLDPSSLLTALALNALVRCKTPAQPLVLCGAACTRQPAPAVPQVATCTWAVHKSACCTPICAAWATPPCCRHASCRCTPAMGLPSQRP